MFSQACVILFTGGGLPQCILGYHHPSPLEQTPQTPPPEQTPSLGADTPPRNRRPLEQTAPFPLPRSRHPPGADTPPHRRAIREEIRSTRGRYASYLNAILFENLSLELSRLNCQISWTLRKENSDIFEPFLLRFIHYVGYVVVVCHHSFHYISLVPLQWQIQIFHFHNGAKKI